MQVAAAPPIAPQSPVKFEEEEEEDWDNLTQEEKTRRQFMEYDRMAYATKERTKKGDEKKASEESEERYKLWQRHLAEVGKKEEAERKEIQQKEMVPHPAGNMAAQNGGFNNGINAVKNEGNRKRRAEEDPYKEQLKAQHQHHWEMQQRQMQMQSYQQAQMMQYNAQQRVPPNGTVPQMYPNFVPYPPCSTAASTSADMGLFPENPQLGSSPVVPPVSTSGTSSTATPPQVAVGQMNHEMGTTPPALLHGSPPDDLVGPNAPDGLEHLLNGMNHESLQDLGQDLGLDCLDEPTTSDGNLQQQFQQQSSSVENLSNVVSPADGFQLPVNGPRSVQSHPNPMSNGNCNPPMTPNSVQQQPAQMQQFPGIGNPMFSSTPKNVVPAMNGAQQMNPASVLSNQMNSLQSPQGMVAMPSPALPPAMHSPHMANLHSPGLPPQVMPNPAMQANTQNPMVVGMGMPPMGMPPMPSMAPGGPMAWPPAAASGGGWPGGMNGMGMPGFPGPPAADMRMMAYPQAMIPQPQVMDMQKWQQNCQKMHYIVSRCPLQPDQQMMVDMKVRQNADVHRADLIRKQCTPQNMGKEMEHRMQFDRLLFSYQLICYQQQKWQQHQQMMAVAAQRSPAFAVYPPPVHPQNPSQMTPYHMGQYPN